MHVQPDLRRADRASTALPRQIINRFDRYAAGYAAHIPLHCCLMPLPTLQCAPAEWSTQHLHMLHAQRADAQECVAKSKHASSSKHAVVVCKQKQQMQCASVVGAVCARAATVLACTTATRVAVCGNACRAEQLSHVCCCLAASECALICLRRQVRSSVCLHVAFTPRCMRAPSPAPACDATAGWVSSCDLQACTATLVANTDTYQLPRDEVLVEPARHHVNIVGDEHARNFAGARVRACAAVPRCKHSKERTCPSACACGRSWQEGRGWGERAQLCQLVT